MATASTASLVDALRQWRILEPMHLEELKTLQARCADPKALARELIQRGWLTAYQANQLLQGKGQELALGSYILLERLGEGGMGQVFKARHRNLGRTVAVKLIRKERLDNPATIKRFQREVRAAAALSHPNIVRAYDADEIGGTYLLVMECVEGATDLNRLVKKNGPLGVEQACEFIRQTALGLQHAFERGLVHRDIKPHNLLLTAGGTAVKVLDMGLARLDHSGLEDDQSSTMTQEGAVMGTPDYIAPEQALESHTVDIRADLYSLGCTFYFLLTGKTPFPGGTMAEKLVKHQMQEPRPVEQLRPDVPPRVAAVVRKLMAKRPQDRFQAPGELATALSGLLNSAPQPGDQTLPAEGSTDIGATWSSLVAPSSPTQALPAAGQAPARSRLRAGLLAGGSAVAVLGGVILWALLPGKETPPEEKDGKRIRPGPVKARVEPDRSTGEPHRPSAPAGDVQATPPPKGALVLFDGKNLDNWVQVNGKDRPTWKLLDDGSVQVHKGSIMTRKQFDGSFQLHVEFMVPSMPSARGQARGNSGVYLQGRYEIQILDSYGLSSTQFDCGAIFGVAAPRVNACRPPSEWQSYDIEFHAPQCTNAKKVGPARITVFHNGVKIHDDVPVHKDDTGQGLAGGPCTPGPIMLQEHGAPVRFRNLWLIPRD